MNKRQTNLLKKLSAAALEIDWNVAFGGKAKGNRHLFRVQKIAKFLQKREGGDLFIVLAGGWIHDVSLAFGSDYNQNFVLTKTKKFLLKFPGLSPEEKAGLLVCAVSHESGLKEITIEAKIVHDADVLDKSGMLGVVRHVWKMTNMLENRVLTGDDDLKKLQKHLKERKQSLYTQSARHLLKKLNAEQVAFFKNKNKAVEIMTLVSEMAASGKTADTISKYLSKKQGYLPVMKLKKQLSCSYLERG